MNPIRACAGTVATFFVGLVLATTLQLPSSSAANVDADALGAAFAGNSNSNYNNNNNNNNTKSQQPPPPPPPPSDLLSYAESLANYTTTLQLPTNSLRNASTGEPLSGSTDAIFVNGNLARVLLATYRLKASQAPASRNNPEYLVEYLRQGLGWCDTFVQLQAPIVSSRGNAAGYWGTGYGNWANCTERPLRGDCQHSGDIYFGDTGTVRVAFHAGTVL